MSVGLICFDMKNYKFCCRTLVGRFIITRLAKESVVRIQEILFSRPGVFNLLYHATPLTDFGMLATPHNDNVKIELRR